MTRPKRPNHRFSLPRGISPPPPEAARRALYFGDATARVKHEWWFHRPSRLWFRFERDTASDTLLSIELLTPHAEAAR